MPSIPRPLALIAALLLASCVIVDDDASPARADSGALAPDDVAPAAGAARGDDALPDTLRALGPETPIPVPAPASGPRDTTPRVATPQELRELSATLIVPVAGARAEDIPDSFADARGTRRHEAIDIHAPRGTPVLSAVAGRVLRLHRSEAGGLMVYAADSTERFILMYAHLDRYADGLRDGAPLRRGEVIGYVGTTGNAPPTVPHLHFAVARAGDLRNWWRGTAVDPRPLLLKQDPAATP